VRLGVRASSEPDCPSKLTVGYSLASDSPSRAAQRRLPLDLGRVTSPSSMKTWTPLTPSRPGDSLSSLLKGTSLGSSGGHGQTIKLPPPTLGAWIGGLPESIHLVIIGFLPVPELPRLAKVSRAFGRLVASDEAWETRCKSLGLDQKDDAQGELGPVHWLRSSTLGTAALG
jgi:hypothetical protein